MESLFLLGQEVFPEQVTTNSLVQNVVYASGTVGALMVVVGLVLLDAASVRRHNVFNATIEKLVGFFLGFTVYFLIGFAIWNWQYNEAFDVLLFNHYLQDRRANEVREFFPRFLNTTSSSLWLRKA